jgi:hypothetical protein
MGLFDFFKKKPAVSSAPQKSDERNMALAMVALSQRTLPDLNKLQSFFEEHWNEKVNITNLRHDSESCSCVLADATIAISLMPMPIPWSQIEGPCATAWYWPEAAESLRNHQFHLIVAVTGSPHDKIDTALLLTKLVAFVAKGVQADGIYWGEGTLVHSVESFLNQALEMSREYLPLYLWIDFRVNSEENSSLTLFTTGMKYFGLMEIEILQSKNPPSMLMDRAFNIAHYLLDNGPILLDGHTIGISQEEKIQVRHLPSIWESSRKVYRLEF